MNEALRKQYEDFPYPPIPFLALPRRRQGKELRYEFGAALARLETSHVGKRILIAGCGTLEPAVVAQAHPQAAEILAVDISERSLTIAKKRLLWMRMSRPLRRLPRMSFVCGDVSELDAGAFDYILASNILHHSEDPARLLASLSACLKPGGLMRIVTYPKGSRHWMRKTSAWLKSQGLKPSQPDLLKKARRAIRALSPSDPVRSCFESQPETRTRAGLIDAFFNACENPLSPLEWESASRAAGLSLLGEAQEENSRSSFLDSALKNPEALSVWEKLQILDDTWELCANPVFWFQKTGSEDLKPAQNSTHETLQDQLNRADNLLRKAGTDLREYQHWLAKEVGPRVNPKKPSEILRGLSLTEHDLERME